MGQKEPWHRRVSSEQRDEISGWLAGSGRYVVTALAVMLIIFGVVGWLS